MKSNKEIQLYCYKTVINNYSIGFALLNFIIIPYYAFDILINESWNYLPLHLKIYIGLSLLIWFLLYIQGKGVWKENSKRDYYYSRIRVYKYMIINILGGYNIAFGFGNVDFINMAEDNSDAFDRWIIYFGLILLSILGILFFSLFNFKLDLNSSDIVLKNFGIAIIIISLIGIVYAGAIFPYRYERNKTIMYSALLVLCVHILIARTIFYLRLLEDNIKDNGNLINK